MHIQNRALTSKTTPKKGPTLYRPEQTGVFHGLRFHTLISDFQSEDTETYLTTKPNILNYGSSGDMIIDLTNTKYLEREKNQILRFFRDMPTGSTFTINNAEYYDPYKDLDLTTEVKSSNDLLNGQYTFTKFEKDKYLLFVNKDTWTDQKINKYLGPFFVKTPQFSKSTYQSVTVTGDNYHVIENNIGLPSESFQMFDFRENDTIQIFNSSNNNEKYIVKKLVTDSVTGVERLYLDEATGLTMEDKIGSPVIINKLVAETQAPSYTSYVEPIRNKHQVIYCSSLNITISTKPTNFGSKYYVNCGRKTELRGTMTLGRSNTYKITFENDMPPLYFSTTPDGTNNLGSRMTTGVRLVGQNGKRNSYIELTIDDETPKYIYYYNEKHPNMGGRIHIVDDCGGITSEDEKRYVEIPSGGGTSTTPMSSPTTPTSPSTGGGYGY
jgi:hypothetical protein